MAATKAQKHTPQKTYGQQVHRGDIGEAKARRILEKDGWKVSFTEGHPHGKCDLQAKKKGCKDRKIQVKRISSRTFCTPAAARRRMAGEPYNIKRLPKDSELWVFDKAGHLYKFGEK